MTKLPEPPYYAVIFPNQHAESTEGYGKAADRMVELAKEQPGYLGIHSARNADGSGLTVSYWADEASIAAWKQNAEHQAAQQGGIDQWYSSYEVIVARVERSYSGPEGRPSS